jgi:hypothetical protein
MKAGGMNDDPRRRFWIDLTAFINLERCSNLVDVLVLMDANADHSDALFTQFLNDCRLFDLHDDTSFSPAPETYHRGSKQIDFILGSFRCGILPDKGVLSSLITEPSLLTSENRISSKIHQVQMLLEGYLGVYEPPIKHKSQNIAHFSKRDSWRITFLGGASNYVPWANN